MRSTCNAKFEAENNGKADEIHDPLPAKLQQTFVSETIMSMIKLNIFVSYCCFCLR